MMGEVKRTFMKAPLASGIENTRIYHEGKPLPVSASDINYHTKSVWSVMNGVEPKFPEDYALMKESGVKYVRFGVDWWKVETARGVYDFSSVEGRLEELEKLGLEPIVDLLHHIGEPDDMPLGPADPNFVERFVGYGVALKRKFPSLKKLTPFNEPTFTLLDRFHFGEWPPFWSIEVDPSLKGSERHEVVKQELHQKVFPPFMNICMGMALLSEAWQELDPEVEIWLNDTCEHHNVPHDPVYQAHLNSRRFIFHDALRGKGRENAYLQEMGCDEWFFEFMDEHALKGTVVWGLDYYATSETRYYPAGSPEGSVSPDPEPLGMVEVAKQYWEHLGRPAMWIAEVNARATIFGRMTWNKLNFLHAIELESLGMDLRAVCVYPGVDSATWAQRAMQWCRRRDPTGSLVHLSEDLQERVRSVMTEVMIEVGNKRMAPAEMPQWEFESPLREEIEGYRRKFMVGEAWDQPWQEQPPFENGEERRKEKKLIPPPFPQLTKN